MQASKTERLLTGAFVMHNLIKSYLLVLALGVGSAAFAQTPDAQQTANPPQAGATMHRSNPNRQAKELGKRLSLSSDQVSQLEPIFADRDQKMAALTSNTSLDPKSMRQQRRAVMMDSEQKVNAVLTPAQQQQWASMKAERQQHGQGQPPAAAPPAVSPSI
jgi:protein CpxP